MDHREVEVDREVGEGVGGRERMREGSRAENARAVLVELE